LKYERLSLVAETSNDIDLTEEKALFTIQFKDKCQNCGKMGHKATDCEDGRDQQQKIETQVICNYCKKPGYYKADCFKLLRKNQNLRKTNIRNCVANNTTDIVLSASKVMSISRVF
jgi:hypothetical protein